MTSKLSFEKIVSIFSFVAGLLAWIFFVRTQLIDGYWFSDDSYFRKIPPFSFSAIFTQLLTPTDASGYYRPLGSILFQVASLFPEQSFASYQWITIFLISLGSLGAFLFTVQLLQSWAGGALAGIFFLYSAVHLKTLLWITLWFQSSSVAFAIFALVFRFKFIETKSNFFRILSLFCWLLSLASNNGIHSFALVLLALDIIWTKKALKESLWMAKDQLLFSFAIFAWIYLFNNPFQKAHIPTSQFFEPSEVLLAFCDYVKSSLYHAPGDSRAWTNEVPFMYESVMGGAFFCSSFLLLRQGWRFLFFPLFFLGAGFVISLHHHRWQIEYGVPLTMAVALTLGAQYAWLIQKSENLAKKIAISLLLVAPPLLYLKCAHESDTMTRNFYAQQEPVKNLIKNLRQLDSQYPIGAPFLVNLNSDYLQSAPTLHYLVNAIDMEFERRLVLFQPEQFLSGEGLGYISAVNPNVKKAVGTQPVIKLLCNDTSCEKTSTGPI